jgi:hypothetical protein
MYLPSIEQNTFILSQPRHQPHDSNAPHLLILSLTPLLITAELT